jgi:hypothetical protein
MISTNLTGNRHCASLYFVFDENIFSRWKNTGQVQRRSANGVRIHLRNEVHFWTDQWERSKILSNYAHHSYGIGWSGKILFFIISFETFNASETGRLRMGDPWIAFTFKNRIWMPGPLQSRHYRSEFGIVNNLFTAWDIMICFPDVVSRNSFIQKTAHNLGIHMLYCFSHVRCQFKWNE